MTLALKTDTLWILASTGQAIRISLKNGVVSLEPSAVSQLSEIRDFAGDPLVPGYV